MANPPTVTSEIVQLQTKGEGTRKAEVLMQRDENEGLSVGILKQTKL